MALFSIEKNKNRIKIILFGIKVSFFINGRNNKILLPDEKGRIKSVRKVKGIRLKFHGSNAVCILPKNNVFKNCFFELWSDACIEIKNPQVCWINNLYLETGCNSKTIIGSNAKFVDTKIYNWGPNTCVKIGDDCMFSDNTLIRTHDGHTLYDITTKEVINKAKDVNIQNHVWVAKNSSILKGSVVPQNTVVAANSVVTSVFDEQNIVLAGNSAKIVKTNVNWDIRAWTRYSKEEVLV